MSNPAEHGTLLLACSPRAGGNCDAAAGLFAGGAGVPENRITYLRDFHIRPCSGCGACAEKARAWKKFRLPRFLEAPGPFLGCPLSLRDESVPLLRLLATAEKLCIIAPVYFYHLPALLKALIDRTQPFWTLRREAGTSVLSAERQCGVILIGARPKGEKLFEGSLLTLKYALAPLGIRLAEPLLLYGLEEPQALAGHGEAARRVAGYGAVMWGKG